MLAISSIISIVGRVHANKRKKIEINKTECQGGGAPTRTSSVFVIGSLATSGRLL